MEQRSELRQLSAFVSIWTYMHPIQAMGVITALGLAIRIVAMLRFDPSTSVSLIDIPKVAYALLHHRGYADVYGAGSGPTAHYGPLHTTMLTGIYAAFGFGGAGLVAQHIFGLTVVAIVSMLLLPLASACELPTISAFLGGLIFCIPSSMTAESGQWEAPLTAVTVCLAIIGAVALSARRVWRDRDAVIAGLLIGIALLNSPPLLLWFLPLAAFAFFLLRQPRFVLMAAVLACAVLLPWAIRNLQALGSPIWSRSNFGLELSLAHNNQTCVQLWDCVDSGLLGQLHPSFNKSERDAVSRLGEVSYNRQKFYQALHWASAHRNAEMKLLAARVFRFWLPTLERSRLQSVVVWTTTILGLIGVVTWFRVSNPAAWIVGTFLLSFPLVYYVMLSSGRYRYPVHPLLVLFAGDFVRRMVIAPRSRSMERETLAHSVSAGAS